MTIKGKCNNIYDNTIFTICLSLTDVTSWSMGIIAHDNYTSICNVHMVYCSVLLKRKVYIDIEINENQTTALLHFLAYDSKQRYFRFGLLHKWRNLQTLLCAPGTWWFTFYRLVVFKNLCPRHTEGQAKISRHTFFFAFTSLHNSLYKTYYLITMYMFGFFYWCQIQFDKQLYHS